MHTAQIEVGRRQRAGIRLPGGKLLVALLLLATPLLATALPRPDPVPGGVAVLTLPAGFDAAAQASFAGKPVLTVPVDRRLAGAGRHPA